MVVGTTRHKVEVALDADQCGIMSLLAVEITEMNVTQQSSLYMTSKPFVEDTIVTIDPQRLPNLNARFGASGLLTSIIFHSRTI